MILLDDANWPAHGTLWGHLVSDRSLDELHDFAHRAAMPVRSFDHDHYDYPAARRKALLDAGATAVPATELVRRLVASGLRVRPRDKTPRRSDARAAARASWAQLLPGAEALGEHLLDRWSEPHRHYHDVRHLTSVLTALGELGGAERSVLLAAWFHDAVHDGRAGEDEEASAQLAETALSDVLPRTEVAEIARLIRLTTHHDPADADADGALLVDADLSVLGTVAGRYHVYARDVRLEYDHVAPPDFVVGRSRVLTQLLEKGPLFRTDHGRAHWWPRAATNMSAELVRLANSRPGASAWHL